jgi:alkaline phosphatase D
LFLWLGDAIYADNWAEDRTESIEGFKFYCSRSKRNFNLLVMTEKWRSAKEAPSYQKLRENSYITGVWVRHWGSQLVSSSHLDQDDHDYGLNNGGAEYANRNETQKMFLNFLDEPADSERWSRPGVYFSFIWGPAGKRILFLMLDVRYFKGVAPDGGRGTLKVCLSCYL